MSTPSSLRTPAILILLACASTGVALPMYQEVIPMPSGPPLVTQWAGWPIGFVVRTAPAFWALPALALTASVLVLNGRRRPAGWTLSLLLAGLVGLGIFGELFLRSEEALHLKRSMYTAGPGPAFYPVAAVVLMALILLMTMPEKKRA